MAKLSIEQAIAAAVSILTAAGGSLGYDDFVSQLPPGIKIESLRQHGRDQIAFKVRMTEAGVEHVVEAVN